jgi:branched-subunit amino acid transport protein
VSVFVVVLVSGAACYALRCSTVLALSRWSMPEPVERALRFVAPASIAALLATTLRADLPGLVTSEAAARAVAIAVAAIVAARTRSATAAVLVGMPAVWITTAIT